MNLSQNIGMITFRLQVRQYAYCSLILLISYINVTYHQTLRWQCRVQVASSVVVARARGPARQSPWRDSSS